MTADCTDDNSGVDDAAMVGEACCGRTISTSATPLWALAQLASDRCRDSMSEQVVSAHLNGVAAVCTVPVLYCGGCSCICMYLHAYYLGSETWPVPHLYCGVVHLSKYLHAY